MTLTSPLSKEIEEFLLQRQKELGDSQFKMIKCQMRNFDSFLCTYAPDLKEITGECIDSWLITRNTGGEGLPRAKNALRQFLYFLKDKGLNPYIPPILKDSARERAEYVYQCLDDKLTKDYLAHIKETTSSADAYREIMHSIQDFDMFLTSNNITAECFDDSTIDQWIDTKNYAKNTIRSQRCYVRKCLAFLIENGLQFHLPATKSKRNDWTFFSYLRKPLEEYLESRRLEGEPNNSTFLKVRGILKSLDTFLVKNCNGDYVTGNDIDSWLETIPVRYASRYKYTARLALKYCRDQGSKLVDMDDLLKDPEDKNRPFQSILKKEIQDYIALRKMSVSTVTFNTDLNVLRSLDDYLTEKNYEADFLPASLLYDWLNRFTCIKSTLNQRITKINKFLQYRASIGKKVTYLPMQSLDDAYVPYFYTEEEYSNIYYWVDNYNLLVKRKCSLPYIMAEFPMVIRIIDGTGMRIGETLSLKYRDYDFENRCFHLMKTKGRKERYIPVDDSLHCILTKYCQAMGIMGNMNAYLFPKYTLEDHLTNDDVRDRISNVYKKLGIVKPKVNEHEPGPCLHSFRHNFVKKAIRRLLRMGYSLEDIWEYLSTYLGHSNIMDTEKYMKFSCEFLDDDMDLFTDFMNIVLEGEEEESES